MTKLYYFRKFCISATYKNSEDTHCLIGHSVTLAASDKRQPDETVRGIIARKMQIGVTLKKSLADKKRNDSRCRKSDEM